MEIKTLIENSNKGEITAFIGEVILEINNDLDEVVIDYLTKFGNHDKINKALQVVELNNDVLNKKYNQLSTSELNKLNVVEALLNNEEVQIFDNINKCLTYREVENLKRVLKKLAEHNKKVIVLSNDIEFLFNLTKKVYAVKDNKIVNKFNPIDWFDAEIYNYVAKPPIIDFVMNLRKKNIKIEDCVETKELLKAIYRSVSK